MPALFACATAAAFLLTAPASAAEPPAPLAAAPLAVAPDAANPASPAAALPPSPVTWELLTPFPASDFEAINLEQFAAEVAAATEGALTLQVLPASPPLQGEGLLRAVAAGRVPAGEFLLAEAGGGDGSFGDGLLSGGAFQVDTVPFLARDYDQARALWEASRPVLQPPLEAAGLHVAFVVPRSPRGLFVNRQLWALEDFRGLRVLNDGPLPAALAPLLGLQRVALPLVSAEVPAGGPGAGPMAGAFRSNQVDAVVAGAPAGVAGQAWGFVGNFYDLRVALPKSVLVFNRAAYQALHPDVQRAVLNASVTAQNRGWQGSVAAHNSALDQLQLGGMTVAVLPAEAADRLLPLGAALARDWARRAGPGAEQIVATYRAAQPPR